VGSPIVASGLVQGCAGLSTGQVALDAAINAAIRNKEIQQKPNPADLRSHTQDVLSLASYSFQHKQPTISQRQHSLSLEQQIAFAGAHGINSIPRQAVADDDLTSTQVVDSKLQPQDSTK
jgi:hypothetical protein